jgi:hypothetical protein
VYDPTKIAIAFSRYAPDNDEDVTMIPICKTAFKSCDESFVYVIRHPAYDFGCTEANDNDVALIILPEGRQITTIRPVALIRNPNVPVAGQESEAFGWGATNCAPEAPSPNEIQTGMLEYLTNRECQDKLGSDYDVTDDILCARTDSIKGVAVGGGDSGRCNFWGLEFL